MVSLFHDMMSNGRDIMTMRHHINMHGQNVMLNAQSCADPEGGGRVQTPLKNHKNIGFLRNSGPDPLKITKLHSQHSMFRLSWARRRNAI